MESPKTRVYRSAKPNVLPSVCHLHLTTHLDVQWKELSYKTHHQLDIFTSLRQYIASVYSTFPFLQKFEIEIYWYSRPTHLEEVVVVFAPWRGPSHPEVEPGHLLFPDTIYVHHSKSTFALWSGRTFVPRVGKRSLKKIIQPQPLLEKCINMYSHLYININVCLPENIMDNLIKLPTAWCYIWRLSSITLHTKYF